MGTKIKMRRATVTEVAEVQAFIAEKVRALSCVLLTENIHVLLPDYMHQQLVEDWYRPKYLARNHGATADGAHMRVMIYSGAHAIPYAPTNQVTVYYSRAVEQVRDDMVFVYDIKGHVYER